MIEKRLICSIHCFRFVLSTANKLTFQSGVSSFVIVVFVLTKRKLYFLHFERLSVLINWNLHSLTFDRGIGVRQRNIPTHFSNLRETSPQVNYNRSIKLIGILDGVK